MAATDADAGVAPARRVLVIGAGALGTVYGACLARGGAHVTLLAREAHARAIRERGEVEVTEEAGRRWTAVLDAEWRPQQVDEHDTVVLLTKSHDSAAALATLDHVRPGVRLAVSLQNGVEKDRVLAAWLGSEAVVGGMSMVGATLDAPGRVSWTLPGSTYVGELPEGTSERCERFANALRAGGMQAVVSPVMLVAEWVKLVHAAPVMTLTALSGRPLHEVLIDPDLGAHYVRALKEGSAVATAAGVALEDLPGMFPVRSIAQATDARALELVQERGRAIAALGKTQVRVSMLVDLERGRPLELGAVHGFLIAEADRLGVAVATTRADMASLEQLQA